MIVKVLIGIKHCMMDILTKKRVSPKYKYVNGFNGFLTKINKADYIEFEMVYETISIGDGLKSNNPWLQELPDPSQEHVGITILLCHHQRIS